MSFPMFGDITDVLIMPWVVPVVFGCLVAIVAIVSGVVSDCVKKVAETKLKQSMVERGYSAAEIERVLRATADEEDEDDDGKPLPGKPIHSGKGYASAVH